MVSWTRHFAGSGTRSVVAESGSGSRPRIFYDKEKKYKPSYLCLLKPLHRTFRPREKPPVQQNFFFILSFFGWPFWPATFHSQIHWPFWIWIQFWSKTLQKCSFNNLELVPLLETKDKLQCPEAVFRTQNWKLAWTPKRRSGISIWNTGNI